MEDRLPKAVIKFIDKRYAEIVNYIKDVAHKTVVNEMGEYVPEIGISLMWQIWRDYIKAN